MNALTASPAEATGGAARTATKNDSPLPVACDQARPASPRMADQLEHLNLAVPDDLALERLGHWHGLHPDRFAPVHVANGVPECGDAAR